MDKHQLPELIAIDGPAASGKTTVGLMLANKLGYLLLDTGLMYRALTLAAIRGNVDTSDGQALAALARAIDLDVLPNQGQTDGRHYTVLLNGEDVTWELRLPAVDSAVSQVSAYPDVRVEMVRRQRAFGRRGRVVMVGRDIGTVVLPDAPLKLYITATAEERARRRLLDRERQGQAADFATILADVVRRDEVDSNRQHSPLRPADDAIIIDTTNCQVEDVVRDVLSLYDHSGEPV